MVITMAKLRMAHGSTHGARKPPGPIFGRFSFFHGQHLVTAAWATPSPWSIFKYFQIFRDLEFWTWDLKFGIQDFGHSFWTTDLFDQLGAAQLSQIF